MSVDTRGVLQLLDRDGVRLLTLDRPESRNAFNQALWCATRDALVDAADDPTIKCVVVTGAGTAFSAGQDLAEMADPSTMGDGEEPGYRTFMPVLEAFPKPLIAAVNGVGVGIGMTMLPHCDLVLMSDEARLKVPFVSLGVTTEGSSSVLLPATVGWQNAAHILFTEPWIDAATAVATGLAWRRYPAGELLDAALALAADIAAMPVSSLVATKQLMLAGRLDAVRAARAREDAEFERLVGSPDNLAALERFFS
jgi:enoyl-CoA hydratase/carnithine racemase